MVVLNVCFIVLYAIVLYVCDKMGLYVGHEMVLSQARFVCLCRDRFGNASLSYSI